MTVLQSVSAISGKVT